MPDPALPYAVLLTVDDVRPGALAQARAARRHEPVQDHMLWARRAWGILAESLPRAEAETEAAFFTTAGLPCVAIPQSLIEELPPAAALERLELLKNGITFEDAGARRVAPAKDIALIAAAGLKETQRKKVKGEEASLGRKAAAMGLGMALGLPGLVKAKGEPDKIVETSDLVFFLDIVLRNPDRRLRIAAASFDYSCLGELMRPDVFGNFRRLVATLKASGALHNAGARILTTGGAVREMGYESLVDLERESRWLLTLRALKA